MLKRIIAILVARNKEFVRDRGTLAWNFILPIFLLVGFSFMFGGDGKALYKVGVLTNEEISIKGIQSKFLNLKYIAKVKYTDKEDAILKIDQHKIDLLVDFDNQKYWVNETSSKGYIIEKLLVANHQNFATQKTSGQAVRYIDWVMPGILGMNMMFSCLFGVGYVIVRYRKNGVLKRFQATPLTTFEFLSAQVLSRLSIVLLVTTILFIGTNLLLDFYVIGSSFNLFIVALVGAISLISLSLLIASASHSEELVGGLLNMVSWPMMFLSGVWFSLEGAHPYVQQAASAFPLTHILQAARAITTDGASLGDIQIHLYVLLVMSVVFLALGSWLFDWGSERA